MEPTSVKWEISINTYRKIIDGLIARHDGRMVGTTGDHVANGPLQIHRR